jgi:hypothetical protein
MPAARKGSTASKQGSGVMRSIILIGLAFFLLASAAWTVDLVRYRPHDNGLDPLRPLTIRIAL